MSRFTQPRVIKRFIILLGVATFIMFSVWAVLKQMKNESPGDFEVRQGDILLSDEKYDKAIDRFEEALSLTPDHRGALGGIAVALIGLGKEDQGSR